MLMATIVFMDIVRFSDKRPEEQQRLVESLHRRVLSELRPISHTDTNGIPVPVYLPTGDGMAVVFIHNEDQAWDRSTIMSLIFSLQSWARDENDSSGAVSLRIGVHLGSVRLIDDLTGKPNVCGDAINYAQRVMDSANAKQVLFSGAAFREHVGVESPMYSEPPFSEKCKAYFSEPVEVYAKRRMRMLVHKMILRPFQKWWYNGDPDSKHIMVVGPSPLPKEIAGDFARQFKHAEHIALIQLKGDRVLEGFSKNLLRLSDNLKVFWVFMTDPEFYTAAFLQKHRQTKQGLYENIKQWKDLFARIRKERPFANLKIGLFNDLAYFGASFFDWEMPGEGEQPGGKIHVSPYIWGVETAECPGYELEWIGATPSPVYKAYVDGLNWLNANTSDILSQ